MSVWDLYEARISSHGSSKRNAALSRELHMLNTKLQETLSYHTVTIDDELCNIAIVNSDNLNEKTIYSTNPDLIKGGELINWMNNYWLVVERDANVEVYTKAKILQCNHLLRWVDSDDIIHEQWCIISDGTKLRD